MAKRRWIVGAVGICLAWRWLHTPDEPAPEPPVLQFAVIKDGFALAEAMTDRHLFEIDRDGKQTKRWAIPLLGDLRIVGTTAGSTVAWIDDKDKVMRLAPVKGDGKLGASTAYGKNASRLCDGAASSDAGFAIAWQSSDRGIWFVRGPLHREIAVADAKVSDAADKPMACAVRSAGEDVALFWRAGRGMHFDFCTSHGCQGLRASIPMKAGDAILDIACQANGCAAVLRSSSGVRLVGFDLRGKQRWQTALTPVIADDVHLVPAGPRAYVVAYKTPEVNVVDRVIAHNGSKELVVVFDKSTSVPAISWARQRLAFAWIDRGDLHTAVIWFD